MTQKELTIYVNGEFLPEGEAKVSVFDRCFLYGDGIFEGITVWKGVPFKLDAHLKRMFYGLSFLLIENPLTPEEWKKAIMETIRLNDLDEGYLRPQVSRGEGISAIRWQPHLLKQAKPNVVIIPEQGLIYGDALKKGFKAKVLSRPRIPSVCIPAGTKHCNYLDSVLGAIEVNTAGMDIGIAVDRDGFVTEGLAYNIFIARNGDLHTPPLTRDLLPGITREVLIEIFKREGTGVFEADFDVFTMSSADEVFFCSTLRLGGSIVEIDGRQIGDGNPGPITKLAGELLLAEMDREVEQFKRFPMP
jgi:branched-chain amino acid aminotransferase